MHCVSFCLLILCPVQCVTAGREFERLVCNLVATFLCHGGLLPRTDQIRHSRDVCSIASEGEATELPPVLNRGQHAVVIVGNVRGTARMIGVGDREHHDASATGDGIAATAHI